MNILTVLAPTQIFWIGFNVCNGLLSSAANGWGDGSGWGWRYIYVLGWGVSKIPVCALSSAHQREGGVFHLFSSKATNKQDHVLMSANIHNESDILFP